MIPRGELKVCTPSIALLRATENTSPSLPTQLSLWKKLMYQCAGRLRHPTDLAACQFGQSESWMHVDFEGLW